jgi:threonine/homoserine/homoserine lactone efflux protein
MESSIVFTYLVAAAASRAMARAVTAVVNTMLVIAVWSALAVMGLMMLAAKLPAVARRLVRPLHFQIHW